MVVDNLVVTRARKLVDGSKPRAEGPKFRKLWKGLRPPDQNFGPETGGVSTISPAKMHSARPFFFVGYKGGKIYCTALEALLGAAGRNWPRPCHQLVEIFKGSLRALVVTMVQW
jgi:hypothetical protein